MLKDQQNRGDLTEGYCSGRSERAWIAPSSHRIIQMEKGAEMAEKREEKGLGKERDQHIGILNKNGP